MLRSLGSFLSNTSVKKLGYFFIFEDLFPVDGISSGFSSRKRVVFPALGEQVVRLSWVRVKELVCLLSDGIPWG